MISNDAYQGLNSVTVPTNVTACPGSTPVRSPISGEMSFEESDSKDSIRNPSFDPTMRLLLNQEQPSTALQESFLMQSIHETSFP